MVAIAPRYDPRILAAVCALDDRAEPMAEVARRVGLVAAELGLAKPSYVHLRRYIRAHRAQEDAERKRASDLKEIVADVYLDAMRGRVVNAYDVAERIRQAGQ
ncbi:MAG TPA: hypothetical protein VFU26_10565 [Gaiellaceae bacterium]|nr:hypothetical protein [Gaiellaceae bacterium]